MKHTHAIGVGCSSKAAAEDLLALIEATAASALPHAVIATVDRRAPVVRPVAELLGLELLLFPAEVLARVAGTVSISAFSLAHTGTGSVAEAAALAALGPGAHLLIPRQTGHLCTCALAFISTRSTYDSSLYRRGTRSRRPADAARPRPAGGLPRLPLRGFACA